MNDEDGSAKDVETSHSSDSFESSRVSRATDQSVKLHREGCKKEPHPPRHLSTHCEHLPDAEHQHHANQLVYVIQSAGDSIKRDNRVRRPLGNSRRVI